MTFVALASVHGIPEFSIFTLIAMVIGALFTGFGVVRIRLAQGNPVEHAKGMNTVVLSGLSTIIVMFLIEIPHMLFF